MTSGIVLFRIGSESYCLPTEDVLEVSQMVTLPDRSADGTTRGMITYRGQVATILDVHTAVNQPPPADLAAASLIFAHSGSNRVVGLVVDEIVDVLPDGLSAEDGRASDVPWVTSIANLDGRLVFRLDLDGLSGPAPAGSQPEGS